MARRATRRTGQLSLAIAKKPKRKPTGRGGWRPDAGRPRGNRVSHGRREAFSDRYPIHVTLRVRDEASGLRRRHVFRVVRRCIAGIHGAPFRVCEFNVLSNHIHLVCEAGGARELGLGVQRLATRIALRVNRCLGRKGTVFADRYHARVLRSPRQTRNALLYVLQNRKHHEPDHRSLSFDPWSSAASFSGWTRPLPRDAAWMREALATAPATALPTTWLLQKGWCRHGLIDLDEAPARPGKRPRKPHEQVISAVARH